MVAILLFTSKRFVVEELINELKQVYGIQLKARTQFEQKQFKMNYYYFIEDSARVK
jgi:kanosamine-6-phosphate phosphatase